MAKNDSIELVRFQHRRMTNSSTRLSTHFLRRQSLLFRRLQLIVEVIVRMDAIELIESKNECYAFLDFNF